MLKNKRRKLECEINRLLIFDNCDGRYSVYTSRGYCLLADTCLEFPKNFAHNFTRYIAYPLSENSKKYLSQYIELSDKTVLAIGKHAMRYALHTDICAYYKDMEDFFSDWCSIGYSRTEARKLIVHTFNGELKCSGKISQYEEELENVGFFRSHKCYLVNMDKVKRFSSSEAEFTDGTTAYVSSRRYAEMKRKYLERKRNISCK